MRNLLLTSALALPLTLGAAFGQDTPPPADPAADPVMTEPAPMATDPAAEPAPMGTDPMATDMEAGETDAAEAAAAASASEKVVQQQAPNELRIDWITGTNVESTTGENIGSISDVIVDGETGELKAAIVGVGGFLGIGQKQIALPWEDLQINYDAREITSDLTREEADAAPEYAFRDREDAPAADGGMASDPAMGTDPAMAPADPAMAPADPAMAPADPAMEPAAEPVTPPATEPAPMATEGEAATEPMGTDTTETPAPAN